MPELRVVDAGEVGAYRSQSLWHGLAEAAVEGAPTTLSFCRSREPYVGLGYHHPLSSLDLEAVRRHGLPVIRRQIGGGAVWVDSDQLLFQLTLPAGDAPPAVARLYQRCLGPAVEAFRALGLPAELRGLNDIAVQGRKVSGTGAGRIGGGVTVVGNVIFRFPHERMVEVLAIGGDGGTGRGKLGRGHELAAGSMGTRSSRFGGGELAEAELGRGPASGGDEGALRRECLRLMRRWVSSLEDEGAGAVTPAMAREALIGAYAAAFGPRVRYDRPRAPELAAMEHWERRFADPEWLAGVTAETSCGAGSPGPAPPGAASSESESSRGGPGKSGAAPSPGPRRAVKIAAGVWLYTAGGPDLRLRASLVEGRIERLAVEGSTVNGAGPLLARTLCGQPLDTGRLAVLLKPFGSLGTRLSVLLGGAAVLR